MKKWRMFRYPVYFFMTVLFLLGILVLSALIPRETIAPQILTSAEEYRFSEDYGEAIPGIPASKLDRYADAILLNIIWHTDPADPLRSVMTAGYLDDHHATKMENLYTAVTEDPGINHQYIRYWHGSTVIVRTLLMFLSLRGIYVFIAVSLCGLTAILVVRIVRRKDPVPVIVLIAAMLGTSCWFVPFSMEYAWMFLLMLAQMHLVISRRFPPDWSGRCLFFLISGIIANFLDFLTTETLTVLVPLLLLLRMDVRAGAARGDRPVLKNLVKNAGKALLAWGIGYLGMWAAKWLITSAVLGENVMPYVTGHIEERLSGDIGLSLPVYAVTGLYRNISCLFPIGYGTVGTVTGVTGFIFLLYWGFTRYRTGFSGAYVLACLAIGLLPYLRYLILMNHSFMHYFFTCRAQIATLIATGLILEELFSGRGQLRGARRN